MRRQESRIRAAGDSNLVFAVFRDRDESQPRMGVYLFNSVQINAFGLQIDKRLRRIIIRPDSRDDFRLRPEPLGCDGHIGAFAAGQGRIDTARDGLACFGQVLRLHDEVQIYGP